MLRGTGVKTVDLSHCSALTTVGSYFLASCGALESVRLPTSVVSIGDGMLCSSGVKTVDLSHCTALTTVGSAFLFSYSAVESVRLPPQLLHNLDILPSRIKACVCPAPVAARGTPSDAGDPIARSPECAADDDEPMAKKRKVAKTGA